MSWGIQTGRGRRGAHLHHDAVNGRLRARRGARLAALTSGGAIPETGDYRVVLDPDGVTVGSVHEDFAVEATAGDIFLLGHPLVAGGQGGDGHGAGPRRRRPPAHHPVLAGRGPGPDGRALRGGGRAAGRARAAAGRRRRAGRPRRWSGPGRGLGGGGRPGGGLPGAGLAALGRRCPPGTASSSSGSSTRARAPSSSCTRPYGGRINRALGPGPAQAVLRLVRLRAAGGGGRRHRGALARAPAQLPAGPGARRCSTAARSPRS